MFAEGVGSGLWPTTEILCIAAITPPLRGDSRPRLSHLGGDRPPPTTRARVSVGPPTEKGTTSLMVRTVCDHAARIGNVTRRRQRFRRIAGMAGDVSWRAPRDKRKLFQFQGV